MGLRACLRFKILIKRSFLRHFFNKSLKILSNISGAFIKEFASKMPLLIKTLNRRQALRKYLQKQKLKALP